MLRVEKHESIETWYSVVVCFILSYSSAIYIGWLASNSVLVSELETFYKDTDFVETLASTAVPLTSTINCFTKFFWVIVLRKLSVKFMAIGASLLFAASVAVSTLNAELWMWILTYSIPVGLNVAILSASNATLQPLYFDRHVGLVNGLSSCAAGLMNFLLPILWGVFIPKFGFGTTLCIFAGIISTNAIPFMFLRREPVVVTRKLSISENTEGIDDVAEPTLSINGTIIIEDDSDRATLTPDIVTSGPSLLQRLKGDFHFELFRDRNFMVFSIGVATVLLGLVSASMHLVAFAKQYFPKENTNLLVSVIGIAATFSKLVSATLVDHLPIKVSYYFIQLTAVLCSLTLIAVSFLMTTTPHFYVIVILIALFGLLESPLHAMPLPILFRLLKKDSIPIAIAYQAAFSGVASAIGPPSSGLLYDLTYSYALCYQVGPIIMLCGAILMFFAKLDVPSGSGSGSGR